MNIIIPLDSNDLKSSQISKLSDSKAWALCRLKNGTTENITTFSDYKDIKETIDYLIIKDQNEDVEEFLDEGIDILVASFQKEIEDILEAFIFRELFDYNG